MAKENIKSKIETLIKPILSEASIELWTIEYERAGDGKQLRIFIDKDGGIDLVDIETQSRLLSKQLDEADLIDESYDLIVSSPGMDRPLLVPAHFARYAGEPVEVSLYKGFNGLKKFSAILHERTDEFLWVTPIDAISLDPTADRMGIPIELVSKVNLKVVF